MPDVIDCLASRREGENEVLWIEIKSEVLNRVGQAARTTILGEVLHPNWVQVICPEESLTGLPHQSIQSYIGGVQYS